MNQAPPPELKDLVAQATGATDLTWQALAGDGSDKLFWRVGCDDQAWVAVSGQNLSPRRRPENRSLDLIGRHLAACGVPTAEIIASRPDEGLFLIGDLGDVSLRQAALEADNRRRLELYQAAVDLLVGIHKLAGDGFDPAWTCQTERYDRDMILKYETGYFLDVFVGGHMARPEWRTLDALPADMAAELRDLAERAAAAGPVSFIHRDYQSNNIHVLDERLHIIDYQGGRLGPVGYDLASLLIDPYVGLSEEMQIGLISRYMIKAMEAGLEIGPRFTTDYDLLAFHRNMQMLAAFSYLTRVKKRPSFGRYLVPAWQSLAARLSRPVFRDYPAVREFMELVLP